MRLELFIAVGGFGLGVLSAIGAFLVWYASSVRKAYAAEREFLHLQRNQEQLIQGVGVLSQEIQELQREMLRIGAYISVVSPPQSSSAKNFPPNG